MYFKQVQSLDTDMTCLFIYTYIHENCPLNCAAVAGYWLVHQH